MSEEIGYQGWANYPTWAVNLWLANDHDLYRATLAAVEDEYDDAPNCLNATAGIWTVEEARRFNTADRLREMVEEGPALLDEASMRSDLLTFALGQVDWQEIADHWLEDISAARGETRSYIYRGIE